MQFVSHSRSIFLTISTPRVVRLLF